MQDRKYESLKATSSALQALRADQQAEAVPAAVVVDDDAERAWLGGFTPILAIVGCAKELIQTK